MIKLKELLTIGEMTYNEGPSNKHQSRIDYPITLFNEFEMPDRPFPGNASKQTLEELKYLVKQEGDGESIKEHDDVAKVFKEKHKEDTPREHHAQGCRSDTRRVHRCSEQASKASKNKVCSVALYIYIFIYIHTHR